jgi:hypothetical protein
LMRMVEHRIADPRVLRRIRWCRRSGEWRVRRDGRRDATGRGDQPLLANIFPALRARSIGPAIDAPRQSAQ